MQREDLGAGVEAALSVTSRRPWRPGLARGRVLGTPSPTRGLDEPSQFCRSLTPHKVLLTDILCADSRPRAPRGWAAISQHQGIQKDTLVFARETLSTSHMVSIDTAIDSETAGLLGHGLVLPKYVRPIHNPILPETLFRNRYRSLPGCI